jgi:hypothetical protein
MRPASLGVLVLLSGVLAAADSKAEAPKPDAPKPAPTTPAPAEKPAEAAPVARQPDPTAAIVAEGKYVYRQRDIDALVLIAMRHAKAKLAKPEEERLREVLTTALLAREPLMDALTALPGGFSGPEREALVLDLLDYQAEPAKAPAAPAPATASTAGTPATAPAAGTTTPSAADNGPLLIRLPPLNLTRSLPGVGKRHLNLTIALFFRDPALAQKLQSRAPLVQDAILGHMQALPPAQFVEPNQLTLKDGITAAILAKVPEFPPDAVLIPQMDTSEVAEAKPAGEAKPAAETKPVDTPKAP